MGAAVNRASRPQSGAQRARARWKPGVSAAAEWAWELSIERGGSLVGLAAGAALSEPRVSLIAVDDGPYLQ